MEKSLIDSWYTGHKLNTFVLMPVFLLAGIALNIYTSPHLILAIIVFILASLLRILVQPKQVNMFTYVVIINIVYHTAAGMLIAEAGWFNPVDGQISLHLIDVKTCIIYLACAIGWKIVGFWIKEIGYGLT